MIERLRQRPCYRLVGVAPLGKVSKFGKECGYFINAKATIHRKVTPIR